MEIVKDIAEELNESPNGVRMILTKAGVYVKKTPATKSSGGGASGSTTTRISKAAAVEDLTAAITDSRKRMSTKILSVNLQGRPRCTLQVFCVSH